MSVLTVLFCAACLDSVRAQTADLSAVVTQKGDVVLCLLKGEILFSDRCSGSGRLTIVQPIKHGSIVWRYATGVVKLENESPPKS